MSVASFLLLKSSVGFMCRLRSPVFDAQVLARQLLEGRVGGVRLQGGVQARPSLVSRVWEGGEGGRCQRSCFACAHALPALTYLLVA